MRTHVLTSIGFALGVGLCADLLPAAEPASGPATNSPALAECHPRGGLPNFFAKLERGEAVRIAYLGGSITAQDGWRPKTLDWFRKQYPQARVSEINAAIGGTGSDLGVFRLQQDVLTHRPDLLFVEFAVNDGGAPHEQIHRCLEGIVRQMWKANPATDLCFVYTLTGNMARDYQAAKTPRSVAAMEALAEFHAIPSVNFGVEVARLEKAGKLIFTGQKPKTDAEKLALGDKILFSPDSVHPYTDSGHQLYLDAVVRSVPAIKAAGRPGPHGLGAPFVADHFEAAKLVPLRRAKLSAGWTKLDAATNRTAKSFANRLPELWCATKPGETLEFRFKGTAVGIYDLLGPDCGQLIVTVDDRPPVTRPRFDAYCTYHRLGMIMLATGLPDTGHSVKVEIHPDQPDKAKILAERHEKIDDPKRFEGTTWYAGSLMLIGDLVE